MMIGIDVRKSVVHRQLSGTHNHFFSLACCCKVYTYIMVRLSVCHWIVAVMQHSDSCYAAVRTLLSDMVYVSILPKLIRFSSSPSSSCTACIHLCGHELPFLDSVTHLGHILQYNLSDTLGINLNKLKDRTRFGKLTAYLPLFPVLVPPSWLGLTVLYSSSSLWSLSSPALHYI